MSESLFAAIDLLCHDSLDSTINEVRARDDDGEITVAMQTVIEAADALARIRIQQPRTLETLRRNGIVFDGPLGNDPENWQHVSFTIYTDLCEVDMWARQALESA